jgi:hypothetical protein
VPQTRLQSIAIDTFLRSSVDDCNAHSQAESIRSARATQSIIGYPKQVFCIVHSEAGSTGSASAANLITEQPNQRISLFNMDMQNVHS